MALQKTAGVAFINHRHDFGLMTGFIGLFDTARDDTSQFTITYTLVFTFTSSLPLLGDGFQRRTFPFIWVPELFSASVSSF
jgi:hypothetical protein